jgi:hypothetical protein
MADASITFKGDRMMSTEGDPVGGHQGLVEHNRLSVTNENVAQRRRAADTYHRADRFETVHS